MHVQEHLDTYLEVSVHEPLWTTEPLRSGKLPRLGKEHYGLRVCRKEIRFQVTEVGTLIRPATVDSVTTLSRRRDV